MFGKKPAFGKPSLGGSKPPFKSAASTSSLPSDNASSYGGYVPSS